MSKSIMGQYLINNTCDIQLNRVYHILSGGKIVKQANGLGNAKHKENLSYFSNDTGNRSLVRELGYSRFYKVNFIGI